MIHNSTNNIVTDPYHLISFLFLLFRNKKYKHPLKYLNIHVIIWFLFLGEGRGRIIIGDVGQANVEELDLLEKGANYGWNVYEGARHNCMKSSCIKGNIGAHQHDQNSQNMQISVR